MRFLERQKTADRIRRETDSKALVIHQIRVLQGINGIMRESFAGQTEREIKERCLRAAREVTGSRFACLGIVGGYDILDGPGVNVKLNGISWMTDPDNTLYWPLARQMRKISRQIMKEGRAFYVNYPELLSDSSAMPEGYSRLRSFLGVPMAHQGNIFGVIVTSNRPDGYGELEMTALEALSGVVVQMLSCRLAEKKSAQQASELLDRKQAEDALNIASRRKDDFLGILSHEIRNPLASITLCLSLLDRTVPGGEQAKKAREILGRQVAQLSRLVDDLLDLTRIAQHNLLLKKEMLELNELVRRVLEDYQGLFQEKEIQLAVDLSPCALHLEADPVRLSQVIGNLLHNAVKFSEPRGFTRVSVSADQLQRSAIIRVEDNGAGIAPNILSNLFKPFMQADPSLQRKGGGMGIGLALAKGLVEVHNGDISAQSKGPGKGSLFTVRLPLAAGSLAAWGNEPAPTVSQQNQRVLVIEDFRDVAETLKSILVDEGFEVMVAYDGAEGIARAKECRPDILLCDIGLPDLDGYQVARTFCSDEKLKDVYLVSLTGYTRPGDHKKAIEAGFHRVLTKPVKPEKLKEILSRPGVY